MQSINVDRISLLEIVKKNREKHKQTFEAAYEIYRQKAILELSLNLKEAERGKKIITTIAMPEPLSFLEDYDQAIQMLEMSIDDSIELTSSNFSNLVLDKWHWNGKFVASISSYSSSARSR